MKHGPKNTKPAIEDWHFGMRLMNTNALDSRRWLVVCLGPASSCIQWRGEVSSCKFLLWLVWQKPMITTTFNKEINTLASHISDTSQTSKVSRLHPLLHLKAWVCAPVVSRAAWHTNRTMWCTKSRYKVEMEKLQEESFSTMLAKRACNVLFVHIWAVSVWRFNLLSISHSQSPLV